MAWKNLKQRDFSDALIAAHPALEELDAVKQLIDWQVIERLLAGIHSKKMGEQSWPPLMMFQVLLLQSWYALSDPAMEKQLARDLLFRRFIGLDLSAGVPDHSTIWRFRQHLAQANLLNTLLAQINEQLANQDLIIKSGEISIIDATVIEAQRCRPGKNAQDENTQDKEASYAVKTAANGKKTCTYGFKGHLNVDEDSFVKKVEFSTGSEHDSQKFEALLTGHEEAAYADKAYDSDKHTELLKKRGVKNCILKKAARGKPLTENENQQNKRHSGIRARVEGVIGVLKRHYGCAKARYLGLARNYARLQLAAIAYNLKRGATLKAEIEAFAG